MRRNVLVGIGMLGLLIACYGWGRTRGQAVVVTTPCRTTRIQEFALKDPGTHTILLTGAEAIEEECEDQRGRLFRRAVKQEIEFSISPPFVLADGTRADHSSKLEKVVTDAYPATSK